MRRNWLSGLFLIIAIWLGTGMLTFAEQRFPPPDFETDYSYPVHHDPAVRSVGLGYVDLVILVGALGLAAYFSVKRRSRKGMVWLSLFSLVYFGFYRLGCVCAIGGIQNAALSLADPSYSIPLVVLGFFLLPLVFAMFFGRVFCAAVCPLGAIQELVVIRPKRVPRWLEQGLGLIPYFYLGFAVFFAITGTSFLICEYDPFVGIFRMDGPFWVLVFGIALLALGMFIGRPYCRYLCPYAVLLRHLSRLTDRHLTITPSDCIRCRLCEDECPYGAIEAPSGRAPKAAAVRRQVVIGLVIFPVLAVLLGWAVSRMSPHFLSWHPVAEVAREILADPAHSGALPDDLALRMTELTDRFRVLGWWLGAFLGLVITGRLCRLSLFRVREDYEVNRAGCVSCARCVDVCPKEWEARGKEFPQAFEHLKDMMGTEPGERARLAAPAPEPAGPPARRPWYWFGLGEGVLTRRMAWVSGVGLGLMLMILAWNHFQSEARNPLLDQRLENLRMELSKTGDREAYQAEIRQIDREIRGGYFHRVTVGDWGGWLALALALVFVTCMKVLSSSEPELPMPKEVPADELEARQASNILMGRRAVLAGGCLLLLLIVAWGFLQPEQFQPLKPVTLAAADEKAGEEEAPTEALSPVPTPEEYLANWYRFRGPGGSGRAGFDPGDDAWVEKMTQVWKQEIDLPGFNSPVIWGDRIFIASADEETREVYAFDRLTGEKLWTCSCPFVEPDAEQAELSEETGYAPSTMVTDGRRVYSIFPNADVFAISADSGEVAWSKALGLPANHYGHATSLEMADRLLLVQLDQGMADEELSALFAFDGATGEEVYRVDRPVDASWTTPVVFRSMEPAQLILTATPYLISYNPMDGTENWRAEVVEGELAPSSIYAGGHVFTVSPYMEMAAVRIDGSGDVTETHVSWQADNGVPDITSPVANEELYWTATTEGTVTCYEIATGEELWQEETDLELYASPSLVGDQLLLVSSEGLLMTIEAGREYAAGGEYDIEERVMASPAFQDGMMYIRSAGSLIGYRIGGEAADEGASAEAIAPVPAPADYLANWYRFRGPGGAGRAGFDPGGGPWVGNMTSSWKQEVALPGFNSPVIWGDRIFIASADEQTREVYAFDRMTGEKLWTCACPFVEPDAEQAELSEETGYAPSTMVTDGRRVYSIFPNADVFAISADSGEVAWSKALGLPENHYGHATSLEMAGRLLFVQLDQGMADEELSALYAFDGASGEEVYRVDRPVDASWTTPVVIRAVQPAQLLLSATPYLISYNPKDGTENWRAEVVEGELAPSQIYAGGLVFTVSPYMEMAAVRIDGSGDVTETNVAWLADNGVPDITSPVASEELYWTATTDGTVTCYEIASGEELWQEETDLELYASPSLVGDQLLLVSSEGLLMTIQAGREYAAVGEFDIGERVMASPAFQDGMMYIRSMQSLMGFEIGGEAAGDGEVRP